ncbi:unnamed protein product [Musa textilis]
MADAISSSSAAAHRLFCSPPPSVRPTGPSSPLFLSFLLKAPLKPRSSIRHRLYHRPLPPLSASCTDDVFAFHDKPREECGSSASSAILMPPGCATWVCTPSSTADRRALASSPPTASLFTSAPASALSLRFSPGLLSWSPWSAPPPSVTTATPRPVPPLPSPTSSPSSPATALASLRSPTTGTSSTTTLSVASSSPGVPSSTPPPTRGHPPPHRHLLLPPPPRPHRRGPRVPRGRLLPRLPYRRQALRRPETPMASAPSSWAAAPTAPSSSPQKPARSASSVPSTCGR